MKARLPNLFTFLIYFSRINCLLCSRSHQRESGDLNRKKISSIEWMKIRCYSKKSFTWVWHWRKEDFNVIRKGSNFESKHKLKELPNETKEYLRVFESFHDGDWRALFLQSIISLSKYRKSCYMRVKKHSASFASIFTVPWIAQLRQFKQFSSDGLLQIFFFVNKILYL